jgi:hypothetical protein
VDADDVRSLARVLLYGGPDTRRALARRIAAEERDDLWELLVATAQSEEAWLLRARCVEVLGLVASNGDADRANRILGALLDAPSSDPSPLHRSVTFS